MRIEILALPLFVALLAGCSSDPKPKPDSAPPDKAGCTGDPQCTAPWQPTDNACGPVERCYQGECIVPPAMTGEPNPQTASIEFGTTPPRTYQVEVVDDRFEITRGLMCRDRMKAEWGMLFHMESTRPQRFWMKNTLIPLDMLFLDEDWKLVGVVTAEPLTLTGRGVSTPSRYVLELNAGEAAKHNLVVGTQARYFPPSSP